MMIELHVNFQHTNCILFELFKNEKQSLQKLCYFVKKKSNSLKLKLEINTFIVCVSCLFVYCSLKNKTKHKSIQNNAHEKNINKLNLLDFEQIL